MNKTRYTDQMTALADLMQADEDYLASLGDPHLDPEDRRFVSEDDMSLSDM